MHGGCALHTWTGKGWGKMALVWGDPWADTAHAMTLQRELITEYARYRTRRWFFKECGVGLASIAAMDLMAKESPSPLAPKKSHYAAKAKLERARSTRLAVEDQASKALLRDEEEARRRCFSLRR